jgi:tetratricopeptide (TPR) repeat protein
MYKGVIVVFIFILAFCLSGFSQTCAERAKEVKPQLSVETIKRYRERLDAALAQMKVSNDADALIWVGRRRAYLGDYKFSIANFTVGMARFWGDARFYRHRGHRYITLRCFDDAIRDLEQAAKLIKGKPDEIEPDGLPNARNIPTSTLQSNIWYHLGLAYYLKGDFKKALKAYKECVKVSKNPDMLVATVHWLYMTLRRLGEEKKAAKALELVAGEQDIIENADYYKLVKLYQGKTRAADLAKELTGGANTTGSASLGYGLGNWQMYNDRRDEAVKVFKTIVAGDQWASFGFIAAEAELARLKP